MYLTPIQTGGSLITVIHVLKGQTCCLSFRKRFDKKLSVFLGQYKNIHTSFQFWYFLDVLCMLSMPLLMATVIEIGIADKISAILPGVV